MKAVLFDFDGVLTTDATGSASICNYIACRTGMDIEKFKNRYLKYNDDLLYGRTKHKDIWPQLCNDLHTDIDISVLYDSFINTPIDGQMAAIAESLKKHGYKTGMITDNKKDRIDSIVNYYGWDKLFDVITVSADVGSGKENEEIFKQTLSKLKLDAGECVFIDNQKKNLIVPEKLGMQVIWFDHDKRNFELLGQTLHDFGISI